MRGLVRAEWTKFRSVPVMPVLAGAVIAVSVLLGWLFAQASAAEYARATAADQAAFDPLQGGSRGVFIVQLLVAALGALVASTEYGSGTIRATVAAAGRRTRLVVAKAALVAVAGLTAGAAAVWGMFLVSQITLAMHGVPRVWLDDPDAVRLLLFGPVVLELVALFGLSLGILLRSTAAAVNTATAFLLLPMFAPIMPDFLGLTLSTWWPNTAAFRSLMPSEGSLPIWMGMGVLAAFVAVMMVWARTRFRTRDV
ncbi:MULTISPECIES: ABC transporter permease [Nonomuraea]|uniref:ABC transporter permease n=1 Tax=Nonomuraea ferruginea TaxID=46174 RepID=A0ABT4SWJ4_9ACTN|nr:ABC transporter permease [Nonomuraea ferruginea]MDA0641623.1 ABC transporter permease [Nonomuraea ferruginea]